MAAIPGRPLRGVISMDTKVLAPTTALLESAAEAGDAAAFIAAAQKIEWSQVPAGAIVQAVRWALAAEAHLYARQLASKGATLHSDDPELQKMARILTLPRVVKTGLPPQPTVTMNQDWLRAHADKYKKQWVALRDGELVAAATKLGDLKIQLGSFDGLMVTRIF
jgi:hypothetical protein